MFFFFIIIIEEVEVEVDEVEVEGKNKTPTSPSQGRFSTKKTNKTSARLTGSRIDSIGKHDALGGYD